MNMRHPSKLGVGVLDLRTAHPLLDLHHGISRRCWAVTVRQRLMDGVNGMLWTLTVILLFLWVLGLVSGVSVGPWIHVLLVIALATLAVSLVRSRV
jgi:hypothetical protein